jgi:lysozyme
MQAEEGTCSASGSWCDANGQCQIGYGHDASSESPCYSAFSQGGIEFTPPLSQSQQTELLFQDAQSVGAQVTAGMSVPLNPHEADALTSFAYNLGIGYLQPGHTLYDYLESGGNDPATITADFELYDQPTSLPGVLNRRYDEAQMYLYGIYTHTAAPANALDTAADCGGGASGTLV